MGFLVLRSPVAAPAGDAAADWNLRSQGAGVLWATNFPDSDSVDDWRFTNENGRGWDPTSIETQSALVRWESGQGIVAGTGCLRCESATSGGTSAYWWRNLDPAVTSGSTTETLVISPGEPLHLQVRCRMNTARVNNVGTDATGLKIFEVNTAVQSLLNQGVHVGRTGARKYVQVLNTIAGQSGIEARYWHYIPSGADYIMQPGSLYGECLYSEGDTGAGCWIIPPDEWVTYHLTLIGAAAGTSATIVRLEVAADDETEYTVIYDRYNNYVTSPYEDGGGWSAIALWNRDEASTGLISGCYHDFAEVIVSRAPIPCPNPTVEAPSWASALTIGRWSAISNNTIDDVNPEDEVGVNPDFPGSAPWHGNNGQDAVIDTWQGGAVAPNLGTYGALLQCGAGHSGYYGNEVYKFDLDTCLWSRITDPAPYSVASNPDTNGEMPDGTPILPHVYDNVEYHPATKSLIMFRLEENSNGGGEISRIAMLNCDTGVWRYTSKSATKGGYAGYSFLDVNRNALVNEGAAEAGKAMNIYRPSYVSSDFTSGAWTHIDFKIGEIDTVVAYDPYRDIAVFALYDGSTVKGLDCSDLTASLVTLTQSGSGLNTSRCGWEYSALKDAFIQHRLGTADVKQFKLTSGTWDSGTWTWSSLLDAGNAVTPTNSSNGMYSRFRLINWGDLEVALVCNSTTSSVYAFRLS